MDLFTALQTAVSGLRAQAYSLDNISGNIANSQTTGYKRIDTSFVDLLAEQSPGREVAGSVAGFARLTNTLQGNIAATGIGTNVALNGEGFFVVQKRTTDASGASVFSGNNLYTRRGDFTPNKDGYLVNGAGSYMVGSTLDPVTGQAVASGPIRVSNDILPAKATTTITYSANLPKTPTTTNASSTPGSELIDLILRGDNTISADDAQLFIDTSIAGPTRTVYTAAGAPVGLQTRWAKTTNGNPDGDQWALYSADNTSVSGAESSWSRVPDTFTFDAAGRLTNPTGGAVTIPDLTVNDINVGDVSLNFGVGGLTAQHAATGGVTTNTLQQDGFASGTLNTVDVTEDGEVTGTYSNGTTLALAHIDVVQFNNANGLKPDSLGNYTQTLASGEPLQGLEAQVSSGAMSSSRIPTLPGSSLR